MPSCQFGSKCYRKNPEHIAQCHPDRAEAKENKKPLSRGTKRKLEQESSHGLSPFEKKNVASVSRVSENRKPLHPIPKAVVDFWKHSEQTNKKDPLGAFSSVKGLRLVGPFEWMAGKLISLDEDQLRLHWRHEDDLPEMQTIAIYKGGRFSLWRDDPNSSDCLLVRVEGNGRQSFPNISVVGDHPAFMLTELGANDDLLPPNMDRDAMKKHAKTVLANRRKKVIGTPLHGSSGPGICVPMKKDVGYRPIPDSNATIKRKLSLIVEERDEEIREKYMNYVREMFALIQMGNDEGDFGMGLEMGHDIFLANGPRLDRAAMQLLTTAYNFLDRDEFANIVRVQFEDGNRRREKFSMLA